MVLAHGEYVEPELIGQLRLFEQLAHPLFRRHARREVGEGCESKFHLDQG